MFYKTFESFLTHLSVDYDLLAEVTQHPDRPRPKREIDQIFMKPGSQLNQLKLVAPLLADRDVVFVGDGDCMALSLGYLAKNGVISGPKMMHVYDFDERIVAFIEKISQELGFGDRIEARKYNVRDPPPQSAARKGDVFYTNPPYGSKNEGFSGIAFLARCMELCKPIGSHGIAILPYHQEEWSRLAMRNIQSFMVAHGYVVTEMLTDMHQYHLDDRPQLRSASVVFERVTEESCDFFGREFETDELSRFYGSKMDRFPSGLALDGELSFDE